MESKSTSPHILSTSATLLGFCLFIITSLHVTDHTEMYLMDESTSIVSVLLTISSLLSFLSIRSRNPHKGKTLENIADLFFILSLLLILVIILFIALEIGTWFGKG